MDEVQNNPLSNLRSLDELLETFQEVIDNNGRFVPLGSGYAVIYDDDDEDDINWLTESSSTSTMTSKTH